MNASENRSPSRRRAFTLTELLIVISIVAMLAAMVFGALQKARTYAAISKTKSLVTRLHYVVMAQYDSYRYRRLPMNLPAYTAQPSEMARLKVNAIRDLMRMEMPDRWTDVTDGPLVSGLPRPTLSQRYLRIYKAALAAAGGDESKLADHAAAECLYMIVMAIPDAAEQFHASEIGDVDHDGLPEFHDAWGRPIRFLRWPAGFIPSNGADTELNDTSKPDPFDPRGVLSPGEGGFALYPLIYSAGPDGEYDINIGKNPDDTPTAYTLTSGNLNPFANDGNGKAVGRPMNNEDGSYSDLEHTDNIHNHWLDLRQGR